MIFVVALISALASQPEAVAPAPQPAASRSVTERVIGRRYDPGVRAREMCTYSGDNERLVCGNLALFNVVESSRTDAPAGVGLTATARQGAGCATAVSLSFSLQAAESISIDWQRSSIDVDGAAQSLLPGFARRVTAAVMQRPTVAAAGVTISEDAFVDPGGPGWACLAGLRPEYAQTVVGLHLAVSIGGRDDVIHIHQRFAWEGATEAAVVALLEVPADVVQPDAPPAPLALIGGLSGGVVGAGIGAALGVAGGLNSNVQSGVALGLCCGIPLAAGLAAAGGFPLAGVEAYQRGEFDKAEAQRRKRRTLLARRAALGIDTAQAH